MVKSLCLFIGSRKSRNDVGQTTIAPHTVTATSIIDQTSARANQLPNSDDWAPPFLNGVTNDRLPTELFPSAKQSSIPQMSNAHTVRWAPFLDRVAIDRLPTDYVPSADRSSVPEVNQFTDLHYDRWAPFLDGVAIDRLPDSLVNNHIVDEVTAVSSTHPAVCQTGPTVEGVMREGVGSSPLLYTGNNNLSFPP